MHEHALAKDVRRRTIAREAAPTATKQGNDTTWGFALSHAEMGVCCMRKGKERMVGMLDEFIELVRTNPDLPVVPMVDEAGRTKYVLDTLQCSYCGRRQPTSDLTPAEYKRMIAESDEKSLVLDDDGR